MVNTRPRVSLIIETSNSFCRGLLRGIHAYCREHGPWSTYLIEQEPGDTRPKLIDDSWKGDGIIARVENRWIAKMISERKLPTVNVSSTSLLPNLPYIEVDEHEVARLSVEHLLQRCFRNFAFFGDKRFAWSQMREKHFVRIISEAKYPCSVYNSNITSHSSRSSKTDENQLIKWLMALPKPVGIFASHDQHGWQLLELCQRIGIAVPDVVAVIGVDNDDVLCNLSYPPLSSVSLDSHRHGYEAARILDRMMAGKKVELLEPMKPLGIVTRQSTEVLAIADPAISMVIRFIREHACEGIQVKDVLDIAPASRRVLERQFKKVLGYTLHGEIRRVQFQHVKKLLTETDMLIAAISKRTGFRFVEYMSTAFKQEVGMSPSEFREKHAQH